MSTRPDIPADVRRFPQDYPPEALAIADNTIERTRGPNAVTMRHAIAELAVDIGVIWHPVETAPLEQTVIAWGNGGQRFMRRDKLGQWRNMMGLPRPAPKLWTLMLANPVETEATEAA